MMKYKVTIIEEKFEELKKNMNEREINIEFWNDQDEIMEIWNFNMNERKNNKNKGEDEIRKSELKMRRKG